MSYDIVGPVFHETIEKNVLPTMRLLDEGSRHPVQAYRAGEYSGKAMWRIRDEASDEAGQEYRLVMVSRVSDPSPWNDDWDK